MNKRYSYPFLLITIFLLIGCSKEVITLNENAIEEKQNPIILKLISNKGDITLALYQDKAPITCKNFINYVEKDFYKNTIFHRVIKDFIIQGGSYESSLQKKNTDSPIINESNDGLSNLKGTIAMSRKIDINSATSEFFINISDNIFLDYKGEPHNEHGYTVFGKVINGMEVVELIGNSETTVSGIYRDVPIKEVIIKDIIILQK